MVVERAVRANSRSAILSLAVAAAEESADRRAIPVFSGGAPAPLGSADLRVRPLGLNRKKLLPTGSQETSIGKEPSAGNTTQSTARLSPAPLSRPPAAGPPCPTAGFESEETRANGQPRDMDRQGTLRWEHNRIYCSTFSCSTLSAPGRWAFVRKHPIRCADKSPWIGQETPLDSSHIPPSFHEQHPSKPCPEGTFFHCPGFVRSTTLGDRTNRSPQP